MRDATTFHSTTLRVISIAALLLFSATSGLTLTLPGRQAYTHIRITEVQIASEIVPGDTAVEESAGVWRDISVSWIDGQQIGEVRLQKVEFLADSFPRLVETSDTCFAVNWTDLSALNHAIYTLASSLDEVAEAGSHDTRDTGWVVVSAISHRGVPLIIRMSLSEAYNPLSTYPGFVEIIRRHVNEW